MLVLFFVLIRYCYVDFWFCMLNGSVTLRFNVRLEY